MGLVPMDKLLAKWRRNAVTNNIPFFVFAVMWDSLATYISSIVYNFFCIWLSKGIYMDCPPPHNVLDQMLDLSPDKNPQAWWLCYSTTMFEGGNYSLPIGKCTVNDKLLNVMDDAHFFDHSTSTVLAFKRIWVAQSTIF